MKICTCEHCRYTFRYPLIPLMCPDCGKKKVRPASKKEILRFRIEQQIIADEIRAGLYHECLLPHRLYADAGGLPVSGGD